MFERWYRGQFCFFEARQDFPRLEAAEKVLCDHLPLVFPAARLSGSFSRVAASLTVKPAPVSEGGQSRGRLRASGEARGS